MVTDRRVTDGKNKVSFENMALHLLVVCALYEQRDTGLKLIMEQ